MAQCKQSPHEFIRNAFTPQIAVMCTPLAEKCCQKNNLDFIELVQPFSRLNSDVHYKDATGPVNIRNFKLTFLDITWRPPQTPLARKLLNSSVSNSPESRYKIFQVGNYKLEIPSSTPWFEAWRDTFLRVQYPSDHEFTKHFLACLLVVSSTDNNPPDTFNQLAQSLNQVQSSAPGKLPKWFSSNILKYYVIVHDNVEGNITVANNSFESIKSSYGAPNCFLLRMNSRPSKSVQSEHLPDPWSQFITNQLDMKEGNQDNASTSSKGFTLEIGQEAEEIKNVQNYHPLSPVNEDSSLGDSVIEDEKPKVPVKQIPHGCCLSTEDVEQVKLLILEFTRSCLLPYIEKQLVMLNDVVSNKKGMSKSLFSATKRWFSPNKPGAGSVAVNNLIYSPDSPELQIRRLGDLYFMFGHYDAAFQAYHLAKRDYNADQAWLYYAGALEMAALSAFMNRDPNRKTCDYMEESITTYLTTCKMPQFATRATILSSECLKHQKMYGDAAHQLIRMTSEESDLRSALLLEQAAYCFLQSKMIRKYAFHMVLAGHRFSKAAQRKHSLKCYKQAYQIYENTGWDLACDHIHYTIGRQANNLQQFEEAVESFSKLLKGGSKQSAQQQAMFLKEYLMILGNKLQSDGNQQSSPILPVPEVNVNSIKVLVGPTRPLSTPGKVPAIGIGFNSTYDLNAESRWYKLEELLLQEAEGSLPMVFKPMVTLYTITQLAKSKPVAIMNEPIQISIELVNTLQTVLHLKDIFLLWGFKSGDAIVTNDALDNKKDDFVKTYITKAVTIDGNSKQDIVLSLMPLVTGVLTVNGFCYTLTGSSATSETSFITGKQLISFPNGGNNLRKGDNSNVELEINVVPSAPCLQITFSEMSLDFLADEVQRISVNFQNISSVPLQNIYLATSVPHLVSYVEFRQPAKTPVDLSDITTPATREKLARKNHITSVPLAGNVLQPGQTTTVNVWVKAPNCKGPAAIDLLVYYENVDKQSIPRYRLIRHCWNLMVQESLSIEMTSQTGHKAKEVEELALALKITNLNKPHSSVLTEITLLNIGLLSKHWSISNDMAMLKYINLHSQESAHILLKAKREVKGTSEYSNMSLNSDQKSYRNFQNIFVAFGRKAEGPQLNVFDDMDCFSYKENKDGNLMLQWRALVIDINNKRVVNGQCVVPIEINRTEEDILQLERILSDNVIDINEKTVLEEECIEVAQNQMAYNLDYQPIVTHNFHKDKLCVVPIKLLLHSIIDTAELKVVINTSETSNAQATINKSNLFYRNASSNFTWLGNSKVIRTVKPLTTEAVMLSACMTGPGTFNLGAHIQISCCKADQVEPYVIQACQLHSALIVHSES